MKIFVRQNKKLVVGTNNSIGRVSFKPNNRIVVNGTNVTKIGKVSFSKISRVDSTILFSTLADVDTSIQQDGDVLVYQSNTNTYIIKTLPKVDGGEF